MNEMRTTERINEPENKIPGKFLLRSLGGAAILFAGVWAGKNLVSHSVPAAQRLLHRLNIAERDGHPQSVDVFKSLAESFGVTVEKDHLTYWSSMLSVARALDTIVDDTQPDSIDNEVGALLDGKPIVGISHTNAKDFQGIVSNASDERRAIIMGGLEVNAIAKKRRAVSEPSEMLKIHREEAELFARIMTLDNPTHERSIDAFNNWLIEFGVAGYQLDSLIDLASDFKNGVTAVAPTPANYLAVGKEAIRDGYLSLSQLPKHTIASLAVAGVKKTARKTLATRTRL